MGMQFPKAYNQLKKELDLKNKELKKKDKIIKNKNKEIRKRDKKIDSLLNSKSWKITKPLRKFKAILKKDD